MVLMVPPTMVAARTSSNSIDGATDNGDSIKCSANNSGSKDLLNSIDGATDNGNSIKCSTNNSGCQHLFDHVQGAARDSE